MIYFIADIQKAAVSLGAIDLLITLLKRNESDIGLCGTAVMCFGNLAEPGSYWNCFNKFFMINF